MMQVLFVLVVASNLDKYASTMCDALVIGYTCASRCLLAKFAERLGPAGIDASFEELCKCSPPGLHARALSGCARNLCIAKGCCAVLCCTQTCDTHAHVRNTLAEFADADTAKSPSARMTLG